MRTVAQPATGEPSTAGGPSPLSPSPKPSATALHYASVTHVARVDDHKAYYPAPSRTIAITGEQRTGRLLGAQLIGHRDTAVATRVDIYAGALHHGMSVDALTDLDLSYTPPLGSPWDAVQMAAQLWVSAHTADLP